MFRELFPQYLMMGMSHQEYWHGEASLARDYRIAYETRLRNEEWARWRQGAYIYDALLRVAPVMRAAFGKWKVEPGRYPGEPWPLTEKEARETEERNRRKRIERMLKSLKKESKMRVVKAAEAAEQGKTEQGTGDTGDVGSATDQ